MLKNKVEKNEKLRNQLSEIRLKDIETTAIEEWFDWAEERLNLFELAVKHAYTPILITDGELDLPGPRILFVNSAFTNMTGYKEEELIGETPRILQGPKTDRFVLDRLRRSLSQGQPFQGENINYRKDGKEYIVEWLIAPIRDKNGQITHFISVQRDLTQQKLAEEALKKAHDQLEKRVEERTEELLNVNQKLILEIEKHKQTLKVLEKRETHLKEQTQRLEELNTALKVLLNQREEDKKVLEENILSNVKKLILPYLEKLKGSSLDKNQRKYTDIIESHIKDIISPFIQDLSSKFLNLTPTEIQVANLLKEGKRTKEIADLLMLSEHTIITHRSNLRKKLGLKKEKINLHSYLQSFQK